MQTAAGFRYANVLPSPEIERMAGRTLRAIDLSALATLKPTAKWWEYEQLVKVSFDSTSRVHDDRGRVAEVCGQCGQCCKDIPSHQIGIYMSPKERVFAGLAGHHVETQGRVTVDGVEFHVLAVKENGDCAMLTEHGCSLGDHKPLWCKIYHCERFVGAAPPWMQTDSDNPLT